MRDSSQDVERRLIEALDGARRRRRRAARTRRSRSVAPSRHHDFERKEAA